jgi:hypothetical protein
MNTVTVKVADLSKIVRENRGKHRAIFEEVLVNYKKQWIAELERMLTRVKRGKVINQYIALPVPKDHTRDYDRILKMLDMHTGETVVISQQDFARYVQDDWEWKREFYTSASNYSDTAKATLDALDTG